MVSVVVVGAGWYGLAAAKTYLEIAPHTNLIIIDSNNSVGGVWCTERVYSGLVAQATPAIFTYSDMPMPPDFETKNGCVSGEAVAKYLENYAVKWGLMKRIRFNTRVSNVDRSEEGYSIEISTKDRASHELAEIIHCKKLIIATGSTHKPSIPMIPQKEFRVPVVHSSELSVFNVDKDTDHSIERVTIVGGGKSAYDAAYMFMKLGKKVHWIIRKNGSGPALLFPERILGIHTISLLHLRIVEAFSPSIMSVSTQSSRLLHGTRVGRLLTKTFWRVLTMLSSRQAGFYKSKNAAKLRPNVNSTFWGTSGIGIQNNSERFWRLFHSSPITVYRGEIISMEHDSVVLDTGEKVVSDLVIMCTGWKESASFFSTDLQRELGLSHPKGPETTTGTTQDHTIETLFPMLAHPPSEYSPTPEAIQEVWPLYRRIVPLHQQKPDNSIVLLGNVQLGSPTAAAEVQALWAAAYLTGNLQLPSLSSMTTETKLWLMWSRKRYLDKSMKAPYCVYEVICYADMLLADLGVRSKRKRNTLSEYFEPYLPEDYRGIVTEWRAAHNS